MGRTRSWLLILSASVLLIGAAHGDVYKYTDPQGNVIFTDEPLRREHLRLDWKRDTAKLAGETDKRILAFGRVAQAPKALVGASASQRRSHYEGLIRAAAMRNRLAPELLHAVIRAESAYDATAVSSAGAIGLMQLMPATADRYDVDDIWNPADNLQGGAAYLRDLLELFDQDLRLALAGYNAGEHAVLRHGRAIPPYPETQTYVRKVLQFLWAEQTSGGRISMR